MIGPNRREMGDSDTKVSLRIDAGEHHDARGKPYPHSWVYMAVNDHGFMGWTCQRSGPPWWTRAFVG
jgi:hypothetical protein